MMKGSPFYRHFAFFYLILLACHFGYAQDYTITNFTTKNGLPSNSIHKCFQDKSGYLWIATSNGLTQFDGTKFKTYGLKSGLRSIEILHINIHDNLIIGFHLNGCFVKNQNGIFDKKDHPLNLITASNHAYNEIIDSILFISTYENAYFFNKNTLDLIRTEPMYSSVPLKQKDGSIQLIETEKIITNFAFRYYLKEPATCFTDKNNKDRVVIYSKDSGSIFLFYKSTKQVTPFYKYHKPISNICLASDSTLYVCIPNGLDIIDLKNNTHHFVLENIQTFSAFEDREGDIWVSTPNEGVFRIHKNNNIVTRKLFDAKFPAVHMMAKFNNRLMFGNNNNGVTELYNNKTNTYHFFNNDVGNRTIAIHPYKNQLLYFTDNFIALGFNTRFDNPFCTKATCRINDSTIILSNCYSTVTYSLSQKKATDTFTVERSAANLLTSKHNLYIATSANLLFKKVASKHIDTLKLEAAAEVITNNIQEDKKKRIWISTTGWGLYLLDENNIILKKFNADNELGSDNILSLQIDESNRIWVGTDNGLALIKETSDNKFEIQKPFSNIGLMNDEVNCILTDKDSIYFSTTKEFVHCIFNERNTAHPLTINILSATANDSSIERYSYKLKPTQNNIAIQLECPAINSVNEPAYYYSILKRNQKDTVWNISSTRNISFNALLPGDYNILFKAIDKSDNSKQSNIQNITFTISEYFYKTWYFIIGIFSLISTIIIITIVSINRFRQNRIRKELENESKINELKLQGLLSQMNPHFLFNSLNVIQKYITSKDEEHALNHLSDFSHLMREILNQTRRGTISLEEEIEFLERYVKLEKPRFDNDFEFIIENNIEEEAHEIRIPPMLIQPLIENAIKHGVSNMKTERGQIRATFNLLNESLLQIVIADNGTYRSDKKTSNKNHQSHALNIIKERVKLLSKENTIGSFELNIFEIGANAVLNIPI